MGPHCFSDNAIYYSVQGRKIRKQIPEHGWCFIRLRLLRSKKKKEKEVTYYVTYYMMFEFPE